MIEVATLNDEIKSLRELLKEKREREEAGKMSLMLSIFIHFKHAHASSCPVSCFTFCLEQVAKAMIQKPIPRALTNTDLKYCITLLITFAKMYCITFFITFFEMYCQYITHYFFAP